MVTTQGMLPLTFSPGRDAEAASSSAVAAAAKAAMMNADRGDSAK